MKLKELSKNTFDQVVALECENIIPVLASVGINLTREMMILELEGAKEDSIILYEEGNSVIGFIVYIINKDHILIKTFNLRRQNSKKTLAGLLSKILEELNSTNIELLISHCHLTNQRSLNLHRGLGFYEASQNDRFIEFHANKNKILDNIKIKCSRI